MSSHDWSDTPWNHQVIGEKNEESSPHGHCAVCLILVERFEKYVSSEPQEEDTILSTVSLRNPRYRGMAEWCHHYELGATCVWLATGLHLLSNCCN